jgi:hypothetical protein
MNGKPKNATFGFKRFICYILAVVMAASATIFISVGITASLLRTNTFVQKRFEAYNSQLLKEVYHELGEVAEKTGIPKKAYTSAFSSKHMQSALHIASNNVVKGYKTDYSESGFLYDYCKNSITKYCKKNDIPITNRQINQYACFAVDAFNKVVGDESTNNIIIIALTYTNKPVFAMLFSLIAFILCIFLIDFISARRHKKYEYMGISFIISGEVMFVLPFFAIIMKYANDLHFTDVDVYNMALADTLNDILKIIMVFGVLVFVLGVFLVVKNYRYYLHKAQSFNTEKQIVKKIKKEQTEK